MKKFNMKHLIIVLFIVLACLYGYAKITSNRIVKEIQNQITIKLLPTYKSEESKTELINLGYTIIDEVVGTEDWEGSHYFTAIKNASSIEVKAEAPYWVGYYYIDTDESITPAIYDVKFGDSFEIVKDKLGINSLNTLFKDLHMLNPGLYIEDGYYIELAKDDWKYLLRFDSNNCLERIEIQNFTVYD